MPSLLEEKSRIRIAIYRRARLHDFLELDFDKVIIRIDMLLHQALDFQERRKQIPFISCGIDGIRQRLVIVERFQ